MFELCVAAPHDACKSAGAQQGPDVSEGAAGTAAGSDGSERTEESEGRGGIKSGEVARIRGSRIANDFSTGGVRQRESWLTCLD